METGKALTTMVKNNPIGAIGGGVLTFVLFRKYSPMKNIWLAGAISVLGAVAGAKIQSKIKAKASVPTKATVES